MLFRSAESVAAEAMKYKTRAAFKRGASGAHGHAIESRILDSICAHMERKRNIWAGRDVAAEALKFFRRCDFKRETFSAYKYAKKIGVLDSICAHMDVLRREWPKGAVFAEAKKYRARGEFQMSASAAYKNALAGGYLDEACAHMDDPEYGFDPSKPAVLYCIAIDAPGCPPLCKIGITNRSAALRLRGMGVPDGASLEVLAEVKFQFGIDARAKEKEIHSALRPHRYRGPKILKNGNNELFSRDAMMHLSQDGILTR